MASRSVAGYRGAATRRSNDDAVRANIPSELQALFNRVGRGMRGGVEARTRAFMQYAHDHPSEVNAALAAASDAKVSAMMSQPRSDRSRFLARMAARGAGASTYAGVTRGEFGLSPAGVPF